MFVKFALDALQPDYKRRMGVYDEEEQESFNALRALPATIATPIAQKIVDNFSKETFEKEPGIFSKTLNVLRNLSKGKPFKSTNSQIKEIHRFAKRHQKKLPMIGGGSRILSTSAPLIGFLGYQKYKDTDPALAHEYKEKGEKGGALGVASALMTDALKTIREHGKMTARPGAQSIKALGARTAVNLIPLLVTQALYNMTKKPKKENTQSDVVVF